LNDERSQREQEEATTRSIDETKDNIKRAIEEARKENPHFTQTVTDLQNETADASKEIADTFLESQKDVVKSMRQSADVMGSWMNMYNTYYNSWGERMMSPDEIANLYAKVVSNIAENFAAWTRIASNLMFAGMEGTRATTRYARENAKEMSRMTSNNARVIGQVAGETARERVSVQGSRQSGAEGTTGITGEVSAGGMRENVGAGTTSRKK